MRTLTLVVFCSGWLVLVGDAEAIQPPAGDPQIERSPSDLTPPQVREQPPPGKNFAAPSPIQKGYPQPQQQWQAGYAPRYYVPRYSAPVRQCGQVRYR